MKGKLKTQEDELRNWEPYSCECFAVPVGAEFVMGSLSFPFQKSIIMVRPQHLPLGPTPLDQLPHTSVHLPPSLPGSYFEPRAWVVSIKVWVPLSSGKTSFPNLGQRAPSE